MTKGPSEGPRPRIADVFQLSKEIARIRILCCAAPNKANQGVTNIPIMHRKQTEIAQDCGWSGACDPPNKSRAAPVDKKLAKRVYLRLQQTSLSSTRNRQAQLSFLAARLRCREPANSRRPCLWRRSRGFFPLPRRRHTVAAERTSASAWASAWTILSSAILVRRVTKSSIRVLASAVEALGFHLGAGDDRFGFFFSLAAFALEIRKQRLSFFAQPARFVELGFDAAVTRRWRRRSCDGRRDKSATR